MRTSALVAVISVGVFASVATSGVARSEVFTGAIQISKSELDSGARYVQDVRVCPVWDYFASDEKESPVVFELELWHRGAEAIELPIALRLEYTEYEVEAVHTNPKEMQQLRLEVPSEVARRWRGCSPWLTIEIGPRTGGPRPDVAWRFRTEASVGVHGASLPGSADVPDVYLELRGQR